MFALDNRVAVITGGSRGLGLAMARAFADHGATVVIASRKADACIAAAEAIGRGAVGLGCHVGDWAQCDALIDDVVARFGRIDVLVNNAGLSPVYESVDQVSEALWDKVIDVNLKGAFRLMARAGALMGDGVGGSIINVSSIAAVSPGRHELPYAAAKAGLNALTAGMAGAFGPTVRVNGIMPGPFLTDIARAWDMEAFEQAAKASIPLQRGGEPDEIVGAALYLASDASSYTTGSIITVDGGMTASR